MKKSLYLVALSALIAIPLVGTASPAFASTRHVTVSSRHQIVSLERIAQNSAYLRPHAYPPGRTQIFCGRSTSGGKTIFKGHDQGNAGNSGFNDGDSQDNSVNNGNQIIHPGGWTGGGYSANQFFCGSSNDDNDVLFLGENQGNTGNEGYNRGSTQDNNVNNGNQIVN